MKVYLTWVSNNPVLQKTRQKNLVCLMGWEFALYFDYTSPGMEKVGRGQDVICLAPRSLRSRSRYDIFISIVRETPVQYDIALG